MPVGCFVKGQKIFAAVKYPQQNKWNNPTLKITDISKFGEKLKSNWCVTGVLYRHTTRSILIIIFNSPHQIQFVIH